MTRYYHTRAPACFNDVQGLPPAKARAEIARRRQAAADLMGVYQNELSAHGLPPDHSLDTLADIFIHMTPKLRMEPTAPPQDLPKLFEDLKGMPIWDFDAQSVPVVVALGFYLGETLSKNFECLEWSVGKKGRGYYGQPIVIGYYQTKYRAENPVMMVSDVILRRYILEGGHESSIRDVLTRHIENAKASLKAWRAMQQTGL